jgi:hypothetical protein
MLRLIRFHGPLLLLACALAAGAVGVGAPARSQTVLEIPAPPEPEDPDQVFIPAGKKPPVAVGEEAATEPSAEPTEPSEPAMEEIEVYIPSVADPAGDPEVAPGDDGEPSDAAVAGTPEPSEVVRIAEDEVSTPEVAEQAEDEERVAQDSVEEEVEFVSREEAGGAAPREIEVDMNMEQVWQVVDPWETEGVEVHRGSVEGESKIRVHEGREEADIKVHGAGDGSGVPVRGGANDRPSGIRVHGGSQGGDGSGIVYH